MFPNPISVEMLEQYSPTTVLLVCTNHDFNPFLSCLYFHLSKVYLGATGLYLIVDGQERGQRELGKTGS